MNHTVDLTEIAGYTYKQEIVGYRGSRNTASRTDTSKSIYASTTVNVVTTVVYTVYKNKEECLRTPYFKEALDLYNAI